MKCLRYYLSHRSRLEIVVPASRLSSITHFMTSLLKDTGLQNLTAVEGKVHYDNQDNKRKQNVHTLEKHLIVAFAHTSTWSIGIRHNRVKTCEFHSLPFLYAL
jgi:hypothetical protein